MKLLIDSSISKPLVSEVLCSHNVTYVTDIFPPATTDEVIYSYAKKNKQVLITSNYKCFEDIGRFPLKKHPGAIVLRATNLTKFGYLLAVLFKYFPNKKDYCEKRMSLNETRLTIKRTNGKSEKKLSDLIPKKKRKPRTRHKSK